MDFTSVYGGIIDAMQQEDNTVGNASFASASQTLIVCTSPHPITITNPQRQTWTTQRWI
jgi:hypothetical protein